MLVANRVLVVIVRRLLPFDVICDTPTLQEIGTVAIVLDGVVGLAGQT